MKQAYLIEIEDINLDELAGILTELASDDYLSDRIVNMFHALYWPLRTSIPVSESLARQAKRDASMEKSNEQTA